MKMLTPTAEIQLNFLSLILTAVTVNSGFGKVKIWTCSWLDWDAIGVAYLIYKKIKPFSKALIYLVLHITIAQVSDIAVSLHFVLIHNLFPEFLGRTSILKLCVETGRIEIVSEDPRFLLRESNEKILWFP